MSSILDDIKKALSLPAENKEFDQEIILFINSAFATLGQLGIGPESGFTISDDTSQWGEFDDNVNLVDLRSYVYLRVRMIFDPPSIGVLSSSFESQINELAWRLSVKREYYNNTLF